MVVLILPLFLCHVFFRGKLPSQYVSCLPRLLLIYVHLLNILQVLNNSLRSGCRTLFAYIVNLDLQNLVCLYLNEPAYLKSHEIVGLSLPTF